MKPIVFQFRVSPEDYRKMSYFNTFSIRRWQSAAIGVCWVGALVLLVLHFSKVIVLTDIMRLCAIIVSLALPVMIFSVEQNVRRYKHNPDAQPQRTLILEEDGVKFRSEGESQTGFVKWDQFITAFETKSQFLLYRDNQHAVLIPKQDESDEKLKSTRTLLSQAMGKSFKNRA